MNNKYRNKFRLLMLTVCTVIFTQSAMAVPTYSIRFEDYNMSSSQGGGLGPGQQSTAPLSDEYHGAGTNGERDAWSRANPWNVGAQTKANSRTNSNGTRNVRSTARFDSGTQVMISSSDPSVTSVQTQMAIILDGTLQTSIPVDASGSATSRADLGVWIGANNFLGTVIGTTFSNRDLSNLTTNGIFDGLVTGDSSFASIDDTWISPILTLPVNTAFSISLELRTWSYGTSNSTSLSAISDTNFLDGLSLPSGIDIFNLSPEFTVNSDDGYIVNNRFLTSIGQETISVPEPMSIALIMLGLVGIGAARRYS